MATPAKSPASSVQQLPSGQASLEIPGFPYAPEDTTAGTENELQACVLGSRSNCDLPLAIEQSRFYENIAQRSARGESPRHILDDLESFLAETRPQREAAWDNSWVRFPARRLGPQATAVLERDLRSATQTTAHHPTHRRSDAERFHFMQDGEPWIRVPVSYLLKLALADAVGRQPAMPGTLRTLAQQLMHHYANDNCSPEVTSFYVVQPQPAGHLGSAVAHEAALRFLFTHLLIRWANLCFGLQEHGQRATVSFSPTPPVRQSQLSHLLSDSFYRELFVSPCLSGWEDGEAKRDYMHLCHQVLTRSQLNALGKLREAGLIANDLIVLPSTSSVSLSNNGTHVTFGSRSLTAAFQSDAAPAPRMEKQLGDLTLKIYEHFLPLFAGLFSTAPYRLGFADFHPERLLTYTPHEMDFTHLRLFWREWKEKASLRAFGIKGFGQPITPYGPRTLDAGLAHLFRLRGDFVPDFRLLSYPVAWLATRRTSALDGSQGNVERLKAELDQLGIFDSRLALYLPGRLRELSKSGYAGFEGRLYSLFPGFERDMASAVNLQQLVLAVAWQWALSGTVTHADIPDDPTSESERRSSLFFTAAGLPAFYVRVNSRNNLLHRLLLRVKNVRLSHRHSGLMRVPVRDYQSALVNVLKEDCAAIVERLGMQPLVEDLNARMEDASQTATHRVTRGILREAGVTPSASYGANGNLHEKALHQPAEEFNLAAEQYYRGPLYHRQLNEAFVLFSHDFNDLLDRIDAGDSELRQMMSAGVRVQDPRRFLQQVRLSVEAGTLSEYEISVLLSLCLVLIWQAQRNTAPATLSATSPTHATGKDAASSHADGTTPIR
ncbi:MAG: hypothetical protein ACYC46_07565 [Acidobacteriaceae bacterium]